MQRTFDKSVFRRRVASLLVDPDEQTAQSILNANLIIEGLVLACTSSHFSIKIFSRVADNA